LRRNLNNSVWQVGPDPEQALDESAGGWVHDVIEVETTCARTAGLLV
jgi:hypothetical protein